MNLVKYHNLPLPYFLIDSKNTQLLGTEHLTFKGSKNGFPSSQKFFFTRKIYQIISFLDMKNQ
jgi:hypothetical protein